MQSFLLLLLCATLIYAAKTKSPTLHPSSAVPTSLPSNLPTLQPTTTFSPTPFPITSSPNAVVTATPETIATTTVPSVNPTSGGASELGTALTSSTLCVNFTSDTLALCNLVQSQLVTQATVTQGLMNDTNQFFLIIMGALVLFMHAGFAMLSAGAVRSKNVQNILLCTTLDLCTCAIAWFLTGFGFAFGADNGDGFIGTTYFVGLSVNSWQQDASSQTSGAGVTMAFWFFEFAFAATSATIVAGAIAERAKFESYMVYSFVASAFTYPVIVHWIWGGGFLTMGGPNPVLGLGSLDFAGDGPVHMIGGISGMIAAKIMGPRIGRFDANGVPQPIPGHSSALVNLGTFCLWFGWFGFNPGSIVNVTNGGSLVSSRCAVNTALASAGATISALFFSYVYRPGRVFDFGVAMNGALAGLVGITGPCAGVEMWAAIVIGVTSGMVYVWASNFTLNTLKIDDPLDATAVHFFCGMWGLLMGGALASPALIAGLSDQPLNTRGGFLYPGAGGDLLACQLVEICCIFVFVSGIMTPIFLSLHYLGLLRIDSTTEEEGLDSSVHGGAAQPELFHAAYYAQKRSGAMQGVQQSSATATNGNAEANGMSKV